MSSHSIAGHDFAATINAHGAELHSLRTNTGHELLWQAHPVWPRHAPNLFPIVGRLENDAFLHRGREYRMKQHGFARDREFIWEEQTPFACRLSLSDDEQTRAIYPFPFRFELSYLIRERALAVTFTVINTGDEILPACMGAHPGFRWPLMDGVLKESYWLEFSQPENAAVRRLRDGLLLAESFPCPVEGRILHLHEGLFANDAIILDKPESRSIVYRAPGAPGIHLSWDDGFPALAIWSKPGADFLCLEPWHGMSSPHGFGGEITEKPGIMLIPPGARRQAAFHIEIL